MLTKKAYTLEEVFLYLEALEMLDMVYTLKKQQMCDGQNKNGTPYNVWIIEYEQGEPFIDTLGIEYEE